MTEFTSEWIAKARNACIFFGEPATTEFRKALDEIERLQQCIAELEQERRWIPVLDWPPEVGWYRVITNNGTEQIRQYVRVPDRDIHYWDVKDGEWIMMYTNPPLPNHHRRENERNTR